MSAFARRIRASRNRRVSLALAAFAVGLGGVAFACGYDSDGTQPAGMVPSDAPAPEASVTPIPDGPLIDGGGVDAPTRHDAGCPVGLPGATMIEVPGAGYCIDATEVTNADYDLFLAKTNNGALDGSIPDGGLPATCASAGLTSFVRTGDPDGGAPNYPAQRVGWCEAFGFCAYAGKRLCTGPSGGTSGRGSGEWYVACSANGARGFPYDPNGSDAHVDLACNDNSLAAVPVGSSATCLGGIPGLFDMSGNVQEWVSVCDDDAGVCDTAGGSFLSGPTSSDCSEIESLPREFATDVTGIRCCADLR